MKFLDQVMRTLPTKKRLLEDTEPQTGYLLQTTSADTRRTRRNVIKYGCRFLHPGRTITSELIRIGRLDLEPITCNQSSGRRVATDSAALQVTKSSRLSLAQRRNPEPQRDLAAATRNRTEEARPETLSDGCKCIDSPDLLAELNLPSSDSDLRQKGRYRHLEQIHVMISSLWIEYLDEVGGGRHGTEDATLHFYRFQCETTQGRSCRGRRIFEHDTVESTIIRFTHCAGYANVRRDSRQDQILDPLKPEHMLEVGVSECSTSRFVDDHFRWKRSQLRYHIVAGLASNEESSKWTFVANTEVLGIVSGSKSFPAGERGKVWSVAYTDKCQKEDEEDQKGGEGEARGWDVFRSCTFGLTYLLV